MSIVLDGTTGITTPGLTNTGTETLVNLTTTGNTTLGDASTDTLNVGNGGLVKDSSGKVGVGATPSYTLDVTAGGSATTWARVFASSGNPGAGVIFAGATNTRKNWVIANQYNVDGGLEFTQTTAAGGSTIGATPAMLLDSSGRLLVGVTSPTQSSTERFEVSGGMSLFIYNDDSVASVYIKNNSTTASTIQPYTYFTDAGSGNRAGFGVKYTDSSFHHYAQGGINWYTGTAGFSNQRMTLDASGNLGIGTTPRAKLEISKSSDSASPSRTPADYSILFTAAQTNTYNNGIGVTEGTYVNSAISPIDTGAGGAQGWAFITGDNTSIAERMRIDSSGAVIVNALSKVSGTTYLSIQGTAGTSNISEWKDNATSYGSGNYYQVYWNSSNSVAGGVAHTAATTVAFNTSSDVRLKENIIDAPSVLDKVISAKVRSFDWKQDKHHVEYGFIAQELYEHLPEAVGKGDDADEITDPKGTWQVEYGRLTPMLVKAIQELKQIVDAQASTIQSLTDRITKLENK